MTPAAFLFDLDGTLIDSERFWALAMVDWLADRGQKTTFERLAPIVSGHSWLDVRVALRNAFPSLAPTTLEEDVVAVRRHFARLVPDPSAMAIPAAWDFLHAAARIAPCAIVSGSPQSEIEKMVRVCGGAADVRFVIGCEGCSRGKPDPEGYLLAASRLGVVPGGCVVVEDSTAGVKAGVAAGMHVVGVRGNELVETDFAGCEWVVGSLSELSPSAMSVESAPCDGRV